MEIHIQYIYHIYIERLYGWIFFVLLNYRYLLDVSKYWRIIVFIHKD